MRDRLSKAGLDGFELVATYIAAWLAAASFHAGDLSVAVAITAIFALTVKYVDQDNTDTSTICFIVYFWAFAAGYLASMSNYGWVNFALIGLSFILLWLIIGSKKV